MTKTMFIKHLITGILSLSSLVFLTVGCGGNSIVDYNDTNHYVYVNELNISVDVEYHWQVMINNVLTDKTKTETIEVGESLTETRRLMGSSDVALSECLSMRFIFEGTKELVYSRDSKEPGSVYDFDNNYTEVKQSKYERTYTYRITQEIYDLATPIAE